MLKNIKSLLVISAAGILLSAGAVAAPAAPASGHAEVQQVQPASSAKAHVAKKKTHAQKHHKAHSAKHAAAKTQAP